MATPSVSTTAYDQFAQWYHRWQAVEMARPIPLLVTSGAPDEAADEVKDTSVVATLDVFA